jgi:hypothetical protein
VKWTSSDSAVITFARRSARGLATALADGNATIYATASRVTGSATVTVGGPQPTLASIDVTPEGGTIVEGETLQFTAIGHYSDLSSQDITATVSWSSSDTAIATIDAAGLASALRFGTSTISATLDGVSASVGLNVQSGMESIEIVPADPTIIVGDQVQFGATAHFSDGSSSDVTPSVVWSSSDSSVATIDANGHAVGLGEGTTAIAAACDTADVCGSLHDTTMLTVTPPEPPPTGESAQELITRDLEAGLIDYPTSLVYRTWALFHDLRLPPPYAGASSAGEDKSFFDQLEADFDSLPADVQAELTPYLVPPIDPQSAFGPAADLVGAQGGLRTGAAAAEDPFSTTRCNAPAGWWHRDWTPAGGGPDDGFRVWVCAASAMEADSVMNPVDAAAAALWDPMTLPEPDGMGQPVPDTVMGGEGFGNGKIDVFVVYTSDCVDRVCPLQGEDGFDLGAELTLHDTCGAIGYPALSCSGYIVVNAAQVFDPPDLKATLAHEFFHVLQDAHVGGTAHARRTGTDPVGNPIWEKSWFTEASAEWAIRRYTNVSSDSYDAFSQDFQNDNLSLLAHEPARHQYGSWVWPLFMELEIGAWSVFQSWVEAESATRPLGIDDAVNETLGFADHFRDFSVRNLNPAEYFADQGVGLEGDSWQGDIDDFPRTRHIYSTGGQLMAVEVAPLAADDAKFVFDDDVRQVTIDASSLINAGNADIDVVGRLAPDGQGDPPEWNRVRGTGTSLTFCRDTPSQNFDLIYVVLSNHGRARSDSGGPDDDAALAGFYQITTKDACDVPDHFDATFSGFWPLGDDWHGTATFDLIGAASSCEDPEHFPPTDDVVYYCYGVGPGQDDSVTWNYTDNQGRHSSVTGPFGPATDWGIVQLNVRDPDPQFQNFYRVALFPRSGGHVMPLPDGGLRDAFDAGFAWISTPFFHYFDGGYDLSGSEQLCNAGSCQGWTWSLQPRWDPD